MRERLKQAREALALRQEDFAARIGLTQTAYSMLETGKRTISPKHIKLICAEFGISELWLTTGAGDMFLTPPDENELSLIYDRLMPPAKQYLLISARELLRMQARLQK